VRVLFDAAFDEFSGFRVQRQLAGNKKQIFCDDSLGIGSDGGRGLSFVCLPVRSEPVEALLRLVELMLVDKALLFNGWSIGELFWLVKGYFALGQGASKMAPGFQ
jgi:hypothetical protein